MPASASESHSVVQTWQTSTASAIYLLRMKPTKMPRCAGKAFKMGNMSSKISQHHYPDRLHKALLINCPGAVPHHRPYVCPLIHILFHCHRMMQPALTVRRCCSTAPSGSTVT